MPACLHLTTPSRLHFGLLACGGTGAARQFGGVGLMVDAPGLDLSAEPAPTWSVQGALADRAERVTRLLVERLAARSISVPASRITIHQAPPEHVGLGTGTQLSLALARVVTTLAGLADLSIADLGQLAGRGLRSGVGLHGFVHGGLIVDGGRPADGPARMPPLVARCLLPERWNVLLVIPPGRAGLSGNSERQAFQSLPPVPEAVTDRLCRLVLLGLLPAAAESDLAAFGAALSDIQALVGGVFAPAQGGRIYADDRLEALAGILQQEGLLGVGQSSWGPTLYGFSDADPAPRHRIATRIRERAQLAPDTVFWTQPSRQGARQHGPDAAGMTHQRGSS